MSKAIITVGISGSGKTTHAEELCKKDKSYVNANRDDLRFTLTGTSGWSEYKFNRSIEGVVTELQKSICALAIKQGKNVVISDTNLNPKTREMWYTYLTKLGFEVEYKAFPVDIQVAIKRDQQRLNSVGYEVIHKQWQQWLDYIDFKRYIPNDNLPDAVIFDVDGTLADMEDVRGPFEWTKVGLDKRVDVIADMAEAYADKGYTIIVCSGRDGVCEQESRKWLDENVLGYEEFFIRTARDNRKDSIVKQEIFWDSIAPRYNIQAVVDDRPQVCRMWRDLGLKVIQVADPYKEF